MLLLGLHLWNNIVLKKIIPKIKEILLDFIFNAQILII